jgi:hypothetical protein
MKFLCKLAVWYLKKQNMEFFHQTGRGVNGRFTHAEAVVITVNGWTAFYLYKYKESNQSKSLESSPGPQYRVEGVQDRVEGAQGYYAGPINEGSVHSKLTTD